MISNQQKRLLQAFDAPLWRVRPGMLDPTKVTQVEPSATPLAEGNGEREIICLCNGDISATSEPLLTNLIAALRSAPAQRPPRMVRIDQDSGDTACLTSIQPGSWVIKIDCELELTDDGLRVISIPSWSTFRQDPAVKRHVWRQICQVIEQRGA